MTKRAVLFTLICVGVGLVWGVGMTALSEKASGFRPFKVRPISVDLRAKRFIEKHEKILKPLEKRANLAWWNANLSGKDADFEKKELAQNKVDEALSNPLMFRELKQIQQLSLTDPILKRQVEVLYLQYLEKQVPPPLLRKIVKKANKIEKVFNVFRSKVGDKELSQNEVVKVLKESTDSEERRKVWEASKEVGVVVEKDLKLLVRLRNQAAVRLGFKNYHEMMLFINEQKKEEILSLFDTLDKLTKDGFFRVKSEIDQALAKRFGVAVDLLQSWHYADLFFQELPSVFDVDLDRLYSGKDILKLCREFYLGIGLPIDDVLSRSDLYEKKGKSPHAFCTDIDREGDVRVLANIVSNEYWIETLLHELGHATYSSKFISKSLPYVLRTEAHILTTEGIAMLFGRFSKSAIWQNAMGITSDQSKTQSNQKLMRAQLLIFSRWCQVMLHFEMGLYENPDQDLNGYWWDLVEKFQGIRRPKGRNKPDYASKIHIVSAPVYYHNYMMGELFASQVHHAIARTVGVDARTLNYVGRPEIGDFLKKRVFEPGRSLNWNQLTQYATGETLNPNAFALDIKG